MSATEAAFASPSLSEIFGVGTLAHMTTTRLMLLLALSLSQAFPMRTLAHMTTAGLVLLLAALLGQSFRVRTLLRMAAMLNPMAHSDRMRP